MSDPIHCPDCGAELPAGQPKALCARCALKGALNLSNEDSQTGLATLAEAGDRIGRYKLLEKIGEGGCGEVYMAEQEEPVRRRVALKIIKPGMDTREVIARFEAERQALALMDHPYIAKIFDGGVTGGPHPQPLSHPMGEGGRRPGEGAASLTPHSSLLTSPARPYFVMELVRGLRITDYCDQKALSTRQRLDLFMQVCQAVQHAHQKGIIHRDLKPSNILVTVNDGVPVPKVIDFGIAKATGLRLTDKTLFTKFHQLIGTPAYMSPEQAEMTSVDIDTRSDIYSLGVLLYELLTGRPPFDGKQLLRAGLEEMLRTIREHEPARPSARLSALAIAEQTTVARQRQTDAPQLIHLLRGDLDWIVMKCLEKDRARRYDTASNFAEDIKRHLQRQPVVARPPTTLYRFQKMVDRHKLALAAGLAITTALVFGMTFSTWMFFRERAARQLAVEEKRRANLSASVLQAVNASMSRQLRVGLSAPRLSVSKWIQGDPVEEFARDTAYVVEFWATWCGPCRDSVPHLNALHEKYKNQGLVVIGQNVRETQVDAAIPFVEEMGTNLTYRVALDTEDDTMARTWMDAAGQGGIPVAFVVDKQGVIAWIGHPSGLNESLIEQILAGSFDIGKATADYALHRTHEAQLKMLMAEFDRHMRDEAWDAAEATLHDVEGIWPEQHRGDFDLLRFDFLLERRQYALAYKLAAEVSEANPRNAMLQNSIAWTIATKEDLLERDLRLAEIIARRANSTRGLNEAQQAEILDTLARVLFLKGEKIPALELQEQAVALAGGARKEQFSRVLSNYKEGRLPSDAALNRFHREISRSIEKGKWDKAEAALSALEQEALPGDWRRVESYRFRILAGRGDTDRAAAVAEKLAPVPEKDAMTLNELAWGIAIRDGATPRELGVAEVIARRANEATASTNAEILDTLARLVFRRGDETAALELQERAVHFARGYRKTQFKETFDSYRAGTLPQPY